MTVPPGSPRAGTPEGILLEPGAFPVGVYLHVPFCRAICSYCAFAKGEYDESRANFWLEALERELGFRARHTWSGTPEVDTVFLGGGTPSALTESQWERLGRLLGGAFSYTPDVEFTSEANPESFTPARAEAMVAAGVNRVSLGVQSFDPAELALLGRIHGETEVRRAVETARAAGIANLNLDLMFALPGQRLETFARTLDGVLALGPEHLSAYCLGLEPGTRLAGEVDRGERETPDDDRARDFYDHLVERCEAEGLPPYEISNFARPGRECRHNLRYWTRTDFIALGPSAHGLLAGRRWANPAPLETWARAYAPGGKGIAPRAVPVAEARFEWIFLHLRLMRGFSLEEYQRVWGERFLHRYGSLVERLVAEGSLQLRGDRLRLTRSHWFLSDGVFSEFAPGTGPDPRVGRDGGAPTDATGPAPDPPDPHGP